MNRTLLLGTLVALAGLGVVFVPELGAGLPLTYGTVLVVGLLALAAGGSLLRTRLGADRDTADLPVVETPREHPVPGDEFDAALAAISPRRNRENDAARAEIRARLEAAALAVLAREGYQRSEGRDLLDAGTWTDDPVAAAFFAAEPPTTTDPDESLGERIRNSVAGGYSFDARANRAAYAIARRAGVGEPVETDGSSTQRRRRDPTQRRATAGETMAEPAVDPRDRSRPEAIDRETGRWLGVGAVALIAAALGTVTAQPALLLAGGVGATFVAYAAAAAPPTGELELTRQVDRSDVAPGDHVRVTLTLTNVGDSTLPDVRVVDGVPPGLDVVDGSPRLGTALRPGRSASLQYTVAASRGAHEFDPATVLLRGFSGAIERETHVEATEPTKLTCVPKLATGVPLPLRTQTTQYTGRVATDTGGPGTEFHAVRDYRPGDPLSRIDWRRAARTGEFATIEYRQEQAATVQLVVDTRQEAYVGPADGPTAVERSVEAAGEVFTSLLATGDQVGLTAYGPMDTWLPPGATDEHRARARHLLATDPAFAPTSSERPFFATIRFDRLRRRLSPETQVVLFSPITDEYILSVAQRLDAYGHRVTVVSPDPGDTGTPGRALARAERAVRLSTLRGAGVRVVDWGDTSLAAAIADARTRWQS